LLGQHIDIKVLMPAEDLLHQKPPLIGIPQATALQEFVEPLLRSERDFDFS
jgi:hypothetical protein